MERVEYRTIDKSSWGIGPWQDEPDKMQWQDEETGLPCLIVRGPVGALCGYVGVAEGHPWHGHEYSKPLRPAEAGEDEWMVDSPESRIRVHGGLTFSAFCRESDDESKGICHRPAPGEPDHVWWFGFDCAHCDDHSPLMKSLYGDDIYRNVEYVQEQCRELARQLAAVI